MSPVRFRWVPALFLLLLLLLVLAGCSAVGGDGLSGVSASAQEIVPGSTGVGKPAGAVEVHYTLGKPEPVTAMLDGPAKSTLLNDTQDAGDHVLRFNGVVATNENAGAYQVTRKAVPDGDYTITISAGGATRTVAFKVSGSKTQPPTLANVLVHPETISPNSDAIDDVAEITFRTAETTTFSVDLTGASGTTAVALPPVRKGPGEQNVVVNGQDELGNVLPDGTYTMTLQAQDSVGNMVQVQRLLTIEGSGKPSIEVVRVEITPRQIIAGQAISVSITVRNSGTVPLRTQGPDPGYTYTTNDSYASIENHKWTDKAGLWRVGVDWDGNSGGGGAYRYPFRWGFGKTLMPGEQVTTGGQIVILKQERQMWFYAGVLQEGVQIVLDRLGRTRIDVSY